MPRANESKSKGRKCLLAWNYFLPPKYLNPPPPLPLHIPVAYDVLPIYIHTHIYIYAFLVVLMLGEWIGFKTVPPDLVVDFDGQKKLDVWKFRV